MQSLLSFLIRYHAFFVFVILEVISLNLIVRNNDKQNKAFVSSANVVAGSFFERYDKITRYWNLGAVNEELARDNKRLLEQLPNAYFDETVDTIVVRDTAYKQQYEYIPAKVVNNSVNRYNNYLTLNRGKKDGIRPNAGVMNGTGLVGIVRNTSEHYAVVISLLHTSTRISAKLKRDDYFGSLVWKENDARFMYLEAIPKHAEVEVGDTVVTSGYSSMFPEGLMIGKIEKVSILNGSNFYHIKVRLSCDLNNVSHVFVVNNLMREEQEALENATIIHE
jgi:rod shape-determining protein MreC